ncbi:MAG: glycogen synthase GlgA [Thermoanaerobaculaceae bacterium]
MRITHIVSEAVPFSKTGGLADVAGALPKAQATLGLEVTVILPAHRESLKTPPTGQLVGTVAAMGLVGKVLQLTQNGVRFLFLDCPPLFVRPGLYSLPEGDFPDNAFRFTWFSRAALSLATASEVIHVHDWQAALVPFLVKSAWTGTEAPPITVITVHNLAYQGLFPPWTLEACQLPRTYFTPEWLEFYGQVNFLKAGLVSASAITTVSPTYAQEILTPAFGCGLEGVLASRRERLFGILNGLDLQLWDPAQDRAIPVPYHRDTATEGKAAAARQLRSQLGMPPSQRPLLGMVSRLTEQKGADVIAGALEAILDLGFDLVVLGTGEARFEDLLRAAQQAHPERVASVCRFDDALARLIYAGSALFLMPSRWEPCGLGQMIAMRYGTLPVAHATGGLVDTIREGEQGTGFLFSPCTPAALLEALARAKTVLDQPEKYMAMRRRAMEQDFSWSSSAAGYRDLYLRLLGEDRGGGK